MRSRLDSLVLGRVPSELLAAIAGCVPRGWRRTFSSVRRARESSEVRLGNLTKGEQEANVVHEIDEQCRCTQLESWQ